MNKWLEMGREAVEHLAEIRKLLAELVRLSREGGR